MKKIVMIAGLLALAACTKEPTGSQTSDTMVTDDSILNSFPSACGTDGKMCQKSTADDGADTMPDNAMSESDLDNSSDAMMAEQASDEEKERLLENLNPNSTNDLYVFRDKATGCEFVQVENDSYSSDGAKTLVVFPRPNGKGGQRGCGTGTDFKKGNAE